MDLRTRARRIAERAKHGRNYDTLRSQRRQIRRLRRKVAEQQERIEDLQARAQRRHDDVDRDLLDIYTAVKPYTMTGLEKIIALVTAVRHIARADIAGDIVECGVWRGGSVHAVARTLLAEGITYREIHLFDTFEGMTEPTEKDVRSDGRPAAEMLAGATRTQWVWAVASRQDVEAGLRTLDYPYERFHLVQGPVESTIPEHAPERIALLRLDTDWYESTRHELEHLYDRLVPGGVLIIDDYGSWQGSKEATDEFLARLEHPPLMHRAGRARIGVKP
jgi:O-methyltransferase